VQEGASELEREERIATGRLAEPHEDRPREACLEPLVEKPVESAKRKRADVNGLDAVGQRPIEPQRKRSGSDDSFGQEKPDAFGSQAADEETQHVRRGNVEPLHVVHREEKRAELLKHTQGIEKRDGNGAAIRGGSARLLEEESDLERVLLRDRELRQNVADDVSEQVTDRGE
jgi:hypothetical protein